ncbi:MAG: enoyl-CoA hydratase/isomerase family protein [Proteobacteria bacterium]|nr:enoyl-CoA hydratase/isomerase family protein [Pseudomonadota bacterium]
MSEAPALQLTADGDCLRLCLQRPERGNALSDTLVAAFEQALARADALRPRLLTIEGAGANFCTGFDLSDLESETDDSLLARFIRVELLLQAVSAARFPTLAIAQGRALGAGADLFCACSLRWVVGEAEFAFPGAGFGLVLGTGRLADAVGARVAQDWVLSGKRIDTPQALRAGLAHERIAAGALDDERERLLQSQRRLDDATHAAIHEAAAGARRPRGTVGDALDLQRLVRSAARPGLKARIAAYRSATRPR